MSYTISITRCPIPATDAEAWKALDALQKLESGAQSNDFIELIELFKNEFPCICDLPDETVDELGVWSDGPLTGNAGEHCITLGIVYSAVDRVLPVITRIALQNGFALYDPQTGEIFAPDLDLPLPEVLYIPAGPPVDNTPMEQPIAKKSIWKRLLESFKG